MLDHELLVAYLAYGAALDTPVGDATQDYWRRYHACFGALFHDLPEVLTRDVIAPVKRNAQIEEVLKRIEEKQFNEKIVPLLPERMHREIAFFAMDEFKDKSWAPDDWPEYLERQEADREGAPHPGKLIESCDKFAAFMEAFYSLSYGVRSDSLMGAVFPKDKAATASRKKLDDGYAFGQLYDQCTAELATKHGVTEP